MRSLTQTTKDQAKRAGKYSYHAILILALAGQYLGVPLPGSDPELVAKVAELEKRIEDPELKREVAELRREAALLAGKIDLFLSLDARRLKE